MHPIIAIDGPDNVGKSAVAEEMGEILRAIIFHNPDKTSKIYSQFIEPIFRGEEEYEPHYLQLLIAASSIENWTKAHLYREKKTVILDRSPASTYIYSLVAEGINPDWAANLVSNLPKPDYTFVIVGKTFLKHDSANFYIDLYDNDIELQEKIQETFIYEATTKGWRIIDNCFQNRSKTPREIAREIISTLPIIKEYN